MALTQRLRQPPSTAATLRYQDLTGWRRQARPTGEGWQDSEGSGSTGASDTCFDAAQATEAAKAAQATKACEATVAKASEDTKVSVTTGATRTVRTGYKVRCSRRSFVRRFVLYVKRKKR